MVPVTGDTTSESLTDDEKCRLNGILLAELLLSNKYATKEKFWKSFKRIIRNSTAHHERAESILNRFHTTDATWLSNWLMKSYGLSRVSAGVLMEFVGYRYTKGCRECGRFNDLPCCSFCSSKFCDEHMLPCHICIRYGNEVFGRVVRCCCASCTCSWCDGGVCDKHLLKCKCGNHICYNKGCGECESCPAYCASNNSVSLYSHDFFCKDYKRYLRSCPMCRPKLPRPEQCGLCSEKIQSYGKECTEGVEPCQICSLWVCTVCSRKCGECAMRVCETCVDSDQVLRCGICSHYGVFCGKCRTTCHCAQTLSTARRSGRTQKKKVRSDSKKSSKKKSASKSTATRSTK